MTDWLDIAAEWSYWDHPPLKTIARDVSLPETLSPRRCLVISGPRRSGKSTLMHQLMAHYRLEPKDCLFANFEDPRFSNAQSFETLEHLVREFRKARSEQASLTFFFDEIQWIQGWQRWLRTQLERPRGNQFIISGSNAHLLSGELGSSLTGRHVSLELYPFSLAERRKAKSTTTVVEYLRTGGFPEPVLYSDGERLLQQYFGDIIERDVRERVAARSSQPLRQLVQMVYESAGSESSVRRLAGAVGMAVDTAQTYLDACEAAYLLFGCQFFAYSERKRANYNKKYYPIDTALRRIAVTKGEADNSKNLECATYVALRRAGQRVFYWRGKGEVDFVVHRAGGELTPVQVTWEALSERHLRALDEFYASFPNTTESITVTRRNFADVESMSW